MVVIRGKEVSLNTKEIVVGDIFQLGAGD